MTSTTEQADNTNEKAFGPISCIDELPSGPLYVFGYGSLLWRPGFHYLRTATTHIHGYHRALRVWSFHHRGTPEVPGLVLGLDQGGSCLGTVFEVAPEHKRAVAEYLWAREMVSAVYIPRLVHVAFATERVTALAFVLDRSHPQYAGCLSSAEAARHIGVAVGHSGNNPEYVRETVGGLKRLGVHDRGLQQVVALLDAECTE